MSGRRTCESICHIPFHYSMGAVNSVWHHPNCASNSNSNVLRENLKSEVFSSSLFSSCGGSDTDSFSKLRNRCTTDKLGELIMSLRPLAADRTACPCLHQPLLKEKFSPCSMLIDAPGRSLNSGGVKTRGRCVVWGDGHYERICAVSTAGCVGGVSIETRSLLRLPVLILCKLEGSGR